MGIGDDIIATGLARGAAACGRRIAFGDCKTIKWGPYSEMIFKNNPNVARPGSEKAKDLEWIGYYKGSRIYNSHRPGANCWTWNYDFKVEPGEIFFDSHEDIYERNDKLILIEPNVPKKPCGPNKQWPVDRWAALARLLELNGWQVRQFEYGGPNHVAPRTLTRDFRHAAALLKSARLAILPEGGLHHAAAAVGTPAVVLFGGYTPPAILGYKGHANLTGGATACGSFNPCKHCAEAMGNIEVRDVLSIAARWL
jgi:Glycosyltransferase family 9 (heptosyltransferase)